VILNLLDLEKVENISNLSLCAVDERKGEQVIGIAGLKAQRLWMIIEKSRELLKAKIEEANKSLVPLTVERIQSLDKEFESDAGRIRLLQRVFWQEIREDFAAQIDNSEADLGIRKDWQIVTIPRSNTIFEKTIIIPLGFGGGRGLEDLSEDDLELILSFRDKCDDPNCPRCHPESPTKT
jgi:hypothetical protein